jgi:hypothetical protein
VTVAPIIDTHPPTLEQYATDLAAAGIRVYRGAPGTIWVQHERWAVTRVPTVHMTPPQLGEIRRLFLMGTALVTYVLAPDGTHRANATLYVRGDPDYGLHRLEEAARRNVRRGVHNLQIQRIGFAELLANGTAAFCDTRRRNGLSDGTPREFARRFAMRSRAQGHVVLAALHQGKIAAFLSITEVDDWVEIEGCFSRTDLLQLRPNDALLYTALLHYLQGRKRRLVDYGISSIQDSRHSDGLHRFKTKIGFEARPVHRAFLLHPILRPLTSRVAMAAIDRLRGLRPEDRRLAKLNGVLLSLRSQRTATRQEMCQ